MQELKRIGRDLGGDVLTGHLFNRLLAFSFISPVAEVAFVIRLKASFHECDNFSAAQSSLCSSRKSTISHTVGALVSK